MKKTIRILLVLMALVMTVTLCGAVLADAAPADKAEETAAAETGDATTTGGEPASTQAPMNFNLYLLDGEGKEISGSTGCLGGGAKLFVKHDYTIVAKRYNDKGETFDTDEELILGVDSDDPHVTLEHNKIKLAASDKPYSFVIRVVDPQNAEGERTVAAAVSKYDFSIIEIVVAFLGVYIIINAIIGKRALFSDEFIKEDKKPLFKRLTMILALAAGLALIASGLVSMLLPYIDSIRTIKLVLLGAAIALLLAMSIIGSVLTDKDKRMKAQETARTGGPTSSAAAFEFDENEPTIDDVLENLNKENENDPDNGENA